MKLTQLAVKPQLIKIVLDDEDTIKTHGDSLEFWVYDKQPIETFVKLASIIELVNTLVLDENGQKILKDGLTLPSDVLLKVVNKTAETLGK